MAETPRESAKGPSGSTDADILPTDRGVARALLHGRVEAARKRPEWVAAMQMAVGLTPPGSSPREVELSALGFLEDGILSLSDFYRAASERGHA
jgi:hypothetical protein